MKLLAIFIESADRVADVELRNIETYELITTVEDSGGPAEEIIQKVETLAASQGHEVVEWSFPVLEVRRVRNADASAWIDAPWQGLPAQTAP